MKGEREKKYREAGNGQGGFYDRENPLTREVVNSER